MKSGAATTNLRSTPAPNNLVQQLIPADYVVKSRKIYSMDLNYALDSESNSAR
jgi:hypothetical protein